MKAKEADKLKFGDRVIAKNGTYIQDATVIRVEHGTKGIRWITYQWFRNGIYGGIATKRHMSVYLPDD